MNNIIIMSSSDSDISPEIEIAAIEAIPTLVPEKSKLVYEAAYKNFGEWLASEDVKTINEKVMLAYFSKKASFFKPSTMWSEYSKLRTTIYLNNNVDISKFTGLIAFLRKKSQGYIAKKSKILNKNDVERFMLEADDQIYLMMKVTLIIGVAGACRRDELVKLSVKNVTDMGEFLKVDIKYRKTNVRREFTISEGNLRSCNLLEIVRKYLALRNMRTSHDRFFVNYRNGKCTVQPVGINTIGAIPKKIATFLGLRNPEAYTGHCFRRSSATLLADLGADLSVLRRQRFWKSKNEADGYVDNIHIQAYEPVAGFSRDFSTFSSSQEFTITDASNKMIVSSYNGSENFVPLPSVNTAQGEETHHRFSGMDSTYEQNVSRIESSKIKDELNENDFESHFIPSSPTSTSPTTASQVDKLEYLLPDGHFSEIQTNPNQNEEANEECSNFSLPVKTTKNELPLQRCDSYGQYVAASLKLMSAWNQTLAISEISNILLKYDPTNPNQG